MTEATEQQNRGKVAGMRSGVPMPEEVEFRELAPVGYYVAIRVGFAFPLAEELAMPAAWVELYSRLGLMLDDPAVRWAYDHSGAIRWSELGAPDPRRVLTQAQDFGLVFGAVAAITGGVRDTQRSFGLFARDDREFTDAELALLAAKLGQRHAELAPPANLTRAELEALRMVKDGMKLREIAGDLGVTEGAIKQRLKNARAKLGARNGSHAVSLAVGAGLI